MRRHVDASACVSCQRIRLALLTLQLCRVKHVTVATTYNTSLGQLASANRASLPYVISTPTLLMVVDVERLKSGT